ncbi:MAG: nucleotidyltransferase domain-containing protein [Planctomycetes bacterium]|nr:nucleotidyltransferase domain-containing protein [Planctomycetota bacterium]
MRDIGLNDHERELILDVLRAHPEVTGAIVFGSRAKGNYRTQSDVDIALFGNVSALRAEAISSEMDDLPLPYKFDVKSFDEIKLPELREHIARVGIVIYGEVAVIL